MTDWIAMIKSIDLEAGTIGVGGVYFVTVLLHLAVPARAVEGYACDRLGRTLKYRLNGFPVMVLVICLWGLAEMVLTEPGERFQFLFRNFTSCLFFANVLGLLLSVRFYLIGQALPKSKVEKYSRCATKDRPGKPIATEADKVAYDNRSNLAHFFLGYEFNHRYGLFDVKMVLYLVGAVMLLLNILSGAAVQHALDGGFSNAMIAYTFCMSWFCVEYILAENVHTYTYDLFAERLGFKLVWGCLVFFPFFYSVPIIQIVNHVEGKDITKAEAAAFVGLYLIGWIFTRGANMQKYWLKRFPTCRTCFWGLVEQRTVNNSTLLCSGFWGLSRHVNYMGEIIQGVAVALPAYLVSDSAQPFLYPAYYFFLLLFRQIDDEALCAAKYGEDWNKYVELVPYRIIPFIY